jgi:hypothetical protein
MSAMRVKLSEADFLRLFAVFFAALEKGILIRLCVAQGSLPVRSRTHGEFRRTALPARGAGSGIWLRDQHEVLSPLLQSPPPPKS